MQPFLGLVRPSHKCLGRDEPSLKTAAKEATVFSAVNTKKNPFERRNFRKFMAYLRLEEEDMLTIGAYTFQSYL